MNDVDLVKSKLNIVDIVSNHITLKKAGRNFFGLCPFHQEETPSFSVNEELNIFKCFGCGAGGDVLEFIKLYNNVDFPQALQIAAKLAGVTLTNTKQDKQKDQKERILALNTLAGEIYHYLLTKHPAGEPYRQYLGKRNISTQSLESFILGCVPQTGIIPILQKKGYHKDELINSGFAIERNGILKDKFRGRIIFPVRNSIGEIVGFTGRLIRSQDYGPKYLNSPQTLVYNKSQILYGLYEAKKAIAKEEYALILEGHMDVLASVQAGITNAIGVQGTSLGDAHLTLLKRYCNKIYFAFDEDGAGEAALIRSLFLAFPKGFTVKVVDMKGKKDPDEFIQTHGSQAWQEQVQNARDAIEHLLHTWEKRYELTDINQRVTFLDKILPIITSLTDTVKEEYYLSQIATICGTSIEILRQRTYHQTKEHKQPEKIKSNSQPLSKEEYFCCFLLQHLFIYPGCADTIDMSYFTDKYVVAILSLLKEHAPKNSQQLLESVKDEKLKEKLVYFLMKDIGNTITSEALALKEISAVLTRLKRDTIKRVIAERKMQIARAESLGEEEKAEQLLQEVQNLFITHNSSH